MKRIENVAGERRPRAIAYAWRGEFQGDECFEGLSVIQNFGSKRFERGMDKSEHGNCETREKVAASRDANAITRGDKSAGSRCNLELFLRRFRWLGKREPRNATDTSEGNLCASFRAAPVYILLSTWGTAARRFPSE